MVFRDFPHSGSLAPSSAWPCKRLCNAFYVVTVITLFSDLFVRWSAYDNRIGRNAIDHPKGQVLAYVFGRRQDEVSLSIQTHDVVVGLFINRYEFGLRV